MLSPLEKRQPDVFQFTLFQSSFRTFAPEAREGNFALCGARPGALPRGPRSLERLANFLGGFADKTLNLKVNAVTPQLIRSD